METKPTYIASCSFGKDSIATILLAYLHNEPLDRIFSVEVMFDNANGISGEIPEHIEWVHNFAVPYLRALFGNKVQIDIVKSKMDYVKAFTRRCTRSKEHPERVGKPRGFLIGGKCVMNWEGKMNTIHEYMKSIETPIISYVGIAADEPERLARLGGDKLSLLEKYGYTEKMAWELCERFGLLSPMYKIGTRGGCWFCPNMKRTQQCHLRKNNPELWKRLEGLYEKHKHEIISYTFSYDKTFEQICKEMDFIDRQTTLDFEE
jgi:3'-phosphoadenosine 5'-phosphosulfate sulfotransferase (PAPS reductase)/FAD synthetase